MKQTRQKSLPDEVRGEIKSARKRLGWTQADLGKQVRLAQRHISAIENGKIMPRYDTLIEILRVLNRDLVLVPRDLLPGVQALVRDYRNRETGGQAAERPLYAIDEEDRDV